MTSSAGAAIAREQRERGIHAKLAAAKLTAAKLTGSTACPP